MLTFLQAGVDFGYEWRWNYAHSIPLAIACLLLLAAWKWSFPRWIQLILAATAAWSLAAFLIVAFLLGSNQPLKMPTPRFLASGQGRVLDAGSGSGRSSLMVLQARPEVHLVALDRFAQGFGIAENGEARLLANLKAAGVAGRAEIVSADMREMPFQDASFDGVVSAFAIDHLGAGAFRLALGEVARVLKPGGEFLFLTVNRDLWLQFAYPLLGGYFGQPAAGERWKTRLAAGGFDIVETGTLPGKLYILCRKR
ncbi:MAG: class I SAM-dependent methyltransferase [Bryobacteraceae bacterium]|nr:class I SAM-dependent methyltransferase [Bryobacteraceae bacterium]